MRDVDDRTAEAADLFTEAEKNALDLFRGLTREAHSGQAAVKATYAGLRKLAEAISVMGREIERKK